MGPENDVLAEFNSPCGEFKLTIDDDGKVAYAYLKKGITILGDVWLYNRCSTPEQPEWVDRRNLPFANCREFTTEEGRFDQAIALDDTQVEWEYEDGLPRALVYVSRRLVATVGVNDKPGYCRFASKDGPLAKVLVADPR
jgi:hypothetical protein